MSYNIDTFVQQATATGTEVNMFDEAIDYTDEMLFTELPAVFTRMVKHDAVNEDAFPVLVYEFEGEPVAWWDCENVSGYYIAG